MQQPVSVPAPVRLRRLVPQAPAPGKGAGVPGAVRRRRSGGPQSAGGAQPAPRGAYYQKDVVQNANRKVGTRKNTGLKKTQQRIGCVHFP